MKSKKKTEIVHRKLGRENAMGQFLEEENLIEIDERLVGKEYFSTALHEALHKAYTKLSEKEILRGERIIIDILWDMGFRWTDLKK